MSISVALIAAVAENNIIGSDTEIPWRIPSDFAWFKRTTLGKPIIMGRKQFEIFGKPLPGRANIVVTRQADYAPEGALVVHDLDAALEKAKAIALADGQSEVMVIGGGDIYAQYIGAADRLYITHVALSPAGNVHFPQIDDAVWEVVEEPVVEPSPKDEASYHIKVYERRGSAAH
jgi:dihydrofolate reductase